MFVFRERTGRVVAAFTHFSDANIYGGDKSSRHYERSEEPGLGQVIQAIADLPKTDSDLPLASK